MNAIQILEAEALAERICADICRIAKDYADEERDVIAALPFLATVDQYFIEKRWVS